MNLINSPRKYEEEKSSGYTRKKITKENYGK